MANIITDDNFEKEIQSTNKLILVDFFATWCNPCSVLSPILDKIAEEFKEKIILVKADLDNIPITAGKFGIEQIPTVVLFKEGKALNGFVGLKPEEVIKDWLKNLILIVESDEYAKKNGFKLNPDKEGLKKVITGLAENEKKYGKRFCPCRRVTGVEEEDLKKICPCFYHKGEIEKNGHCLCSLFFK